MKCVCGFERKPDWQYEDDGEVAPKFAYDEKFQKIEGHFTMLSDNSYAGQQDVRLCACPKCHTVQVEK